MSIGLTWATRLLLPVVVLLSLAASAGAADEGFVLPFTTAERMNTSRIIGGTVSPVGSFPMVLQLRQESTRPGPGNTILRESALCGASLIAARWALTAAHCVFPLRGPQVQPADSRTFLLRGGTAMLDKGGVGVGVVRVIAHEGYRPGLRATATTPEQTSVNDIALLEFAQPLSLPTATLLGAADAKDALAPRPAAAVVVGWGVTQFPPPKDRPAISDTLLQASLDMLDSAFCRRAYPLLPPGDGQFCAGVVDRCTADGQCADSCQGDSGGPLFVSSPYGPRQAGIVSFGDRCGIIGKPGVYTSVAHYQEWISRYVTEARFTGPADPQFAATDTQLAPVSIPVTPDRPALRPGLVVSLQGGASIRLGADLEARLVSNVTGRLLVFNEDERGTGYLVLPNAERPGSTLVTAGRLTLLPDPLKDPYRLVARMPLGKNRLVAIVLPDTPQLDAVLAPMRGAVPIEAFGDFIRKLSEVLVPGRAALGETRYEIVP